MNPANRERSTEIQAPERPSADPSMQEATRSLISRRTFLMLAFGAALAPGTAWAKRPKRVDQENDRKKVIKESSIAPLANKE